MKLLGEALQLAGMLGVVSPWLPDPDDSAASDDLTGWGLALWLLVCAALWAAGVALQRRAQRKARRSARRAR